MPGGQHRLAVGDGRFLLLRLAQLQIAAQAAAVEQGHAEAGAEGKALGVPADVGQLHRLQADAARQGDARIKIALRHADGGRGRVQLRFGAADVGAPPGQAARHTQLHLHGHGRNVLAGRQFRLQGLRRQCQQEGEGIAQAHFALLQRR